MNAYLYYNRISQKCKRFLNILNEFGIENIMIKCYNFHKISFVTEESMFTLYKAVPVDEKTLSIHWEYDGKYTFFKLLWTDRITSRSVFRAVWEGENKTLEWKRTTKIKQYFKLQAVDEETDQVIAESPVFSSDILKAEEPQLEKLDRGLIVVKMHKGVYLGWRLLKDDASDTVFEVFKNGSFFALVTDSTNCQDPNGTDNDIYTVTAVCGDQRGKTSDPVSSRNTGEGYIDIPLHKPADGVTPKGDRYSYSANDMSVADVNGDGELEYILKWDPSNSRDVSQKGYTGPCLIDCYTLSGRLLWRLDLGVNIRSGAHYTQFMVYDFDGDGKAEMALKTAPGTRMTVYAEDGSVQSERYITLPEKDIKAGITNQDNYVCSAADYREHMVNVFMNWHSHPEVVKKRWPASVEECFGIKRKYVYPLRRKNAEILVDYFINEYAPKRSPKNDLNTFEGFIYSGPEYLTVFAGDGTELETVDFPFPRVDDGLLWGDYSWNRIEPCNRVDRFLSGVAYLNGKTPSLLVCRGYYTRTCIAAMDFRDGHFKTLWTIDSGFVPMRNPFAPTPTGAFGTDPDYGFIAGQGNHSLSTGDVDGDGCDEVIYGACVIDHDGSVLYSGAGFLKDGRYLNWGHGDAMQMAVIDPDRPGQQIMHVFEDGSNAPYGEALVDAETGEVIYGEASDEDLGRCMTGRIDPDTRGLQVWVKELRNCDGTRNSLPVPGTNAAIRWSKDRTTQVTDGVDYVHEKHTGIINDPIHGIVLKPQGTLTNNGTKGNPCLIADVFGDWREELILRLEDSSAIRIYTNTDVANLKMTTMLHDVQYRCGVAWQNNCYNQPVYPSFYYGNDMDEL